MEKFKSIPELIQSLNQLAMRINKGSVGLEEFEVTLRDARELYERLVILRYKAIEDRNLMGMSQQQPMSAAEPPVQTKTPPAEPNLAPKQISLIDSIEEIAREDVPEEAPRETPKQPEPEVEVKKPAPEPPVKKEEPKPEPAEAEKAAQKPAPEKTMSTLNEAISNASAGNTLADQLSHSKIDDLNVAIGLNQKFRFIKELFDGDSDAYKKAVKNLNQCADYSEAQQIIENELMKPYGWDEENQTTMVFLGLVERRYTS
jgi:hypothetical protein